MVVVMRRYVKGEQVEVKNTKGTLEDSWHPARIAGGHGDVYGVVYDGDVNGVVEERVLVKYIRPRPPVVKFSNWSHGDLVHIYDNYAWKLATVLEVLENNQFLVRVVGSMKNLNVGAAWIRIRHYWQDDHWIVVGKGPSKSDVNRLVIHLRKISDSGAKQRNSSDRIVIHLKKISDSEAKQRSSSVLQHSEQKCNKVGTKAVKRSAPTTLNQKVARRGLEKIRRTAETTSPCTGTGMRLKVIEEHQSISRPRRTNAALRGAQHEKHQDSGLSSVGSCSINSNGSSHFCCRKYAEHHCDDVSDAESCIGPSPKPEKGHT